MYDWGIIAVSGSRPHHRKIRPRNLPIFQLSSATFYVFRKKDKLMVWSNYIRGMKLTSLTIYNWIRFFFCVVAFRIPSFCYTNYLKYVYFFLCSYFCGQSAYAVAIDIFKRLISFQNNWKTLNLLSFFLFRMYCVVTRSSLRLLSNQNFGKYVYMVDLLLQRITVGVLCSFSDLSFRIQPTKLPYLVSSFICNIYSPGS